MASIEAVRAREVLDSRGNPTLEVEVRLANGVKGLACVPSGASTGKYEALELRDNDKQRFFGKGVLRAVENVNKSIAPALIGLSSLEQATIDQKLIDLDGTPNKSRLGANALLGVSLAVAHAAANFQNLPLYRYLSKTPTYVLPVPMMNILNGGKHAEDSTDFQEFMIVPLGAERFSHALQMGVEVYYALRKILKNEGLSTNVGDEGGFAPSGVSNKLALELVLAAIEAAGYKPGGDCFMALDIAASQFYSEEGYFLSRECVKFSAKQLVDYYSTLVESYPLISLEDGLAEDDWSGWKLLNNKLGKRVLLVGDDLFATNTERLALGISEKVANSILIKPNQVGTLTEAIAAVLKAKEAGWVNIISHRSGETEDTTIADLAVGLGIRLIKAGAPCRGERVNKYNRLLKIEEELGEGASYAGNKVFSNLLEVKSWK